MPGAVRLDRRLFCTKKQGRSAGRRGKVVHGTVQPGQLGLEKAQCMIRGQGSGGNLLAVRSTGKVLQLVADLQLKGFNGPAALRQQPAAFPGGQPREVGSGHLEGCLAGIVGAQRVPQQFLEDLPALRGQGKDQPLPTAPPCAAFRMDLHRSLRGQAMQQVIEGRLLEVRIQGAVGGEDAMQLVAMLRAGLEQTQHHQCADVAGGPVAHSPFGLYGPCPLWSIWTKGQNATRLWRRIPPVSVARSHAGRTPAERAVADANPYHS